MNTKLGSLFFVLLCSISLFAQEKKEVLLTIDDVPVYTSEFKRVYKKNLDLVQDESQKNVESYLDLFIDYKLKVAEAYDQKLHEKEGYRSEYAKYQEQFSRNYLYEDKFVDDLALEAYNRSLEDVDASHILVLSGLDDVPQDTLAAYNKILKIRERAMNGEDFEALAKETSEEPAAKDSGGRLGYFSVFSLVYPFETAAYNTAVGGISDVVRTQYGYHIIKVHDKRKRSPEITTSHIMVSDKEDATRTFNPKERIQEIYQLLQQGESFESLAKQFSDDKNSGKQGGKLNKFGKGDLRSTAFEDAAYALENVGDISEPIKTDFGWHIIRLDEVHPILTYEEMKDGLVQKVTDMPRSKKITNQINKKIKEKYGFQMKNDPTAFFKEFLDENALKRRWTYDTLEPSKNKVIFIVGDREVDYRTFADYIVKRQRELRPFKTLDNLIEVMYDEFETAELKAYFRDRLEDENDDYAAVISEYRDGLLIFDVMNKNVWNKAKKDSTGLETYFASVRNKYQWGQRVEGTIVSATNSEAAKSALQLLEQGSSSEEIKSKLNTQEKINVIVTSGIFEIGDADLPEDFEVRTGVSKTYRIGESYVLVKVDKILPPGPKTLEEVRGKVLSDYQNYVEENWMQSLRSKYKVEVNKKVLKKVTKELES
ncbi:peptidylprolyl isomerase [Altibacter lentus]|uniref:peptidylprolyl isomerase n=1 Tax=Altibacter lentus TaxID=1223410 RepID=UPI0005549D63|nr:peptidylprolyl isomerase [Altibacter lentus]